MKSFVAALAAALVEANYYPQGYSH